MRNLDLYTTLDMASISTSKCYEISATNPGFTPESGGELRQCGEKMHQHLVFGPKVGVGTFLPPEILAKG